MTTKPPYNEGLDLKWTYASGVYSYSMGDLDLGEDDVRRRGEDALRGTDIRG